MRHGKKFNHLGRTSPHRKAMLSNMASSLILNKRISTTVAKAKELRKYVEPLLTRAKDDSTHSRRTVFSYLQNKDSVNILFTEVAEKIATRPGGYTRILKTGNRLGDKADMCIIELVDYNEIYGNESSKTAAKAKTSTRRGRRGAGTTAATATAPADVQPTEIKAKGTKKPKAEASDATKTSPEAEQPKKDDSAPAADAEATK